MSADLARLQRDKFKRTQATHSIFKMKVPNVMYKSEKASFLYLFFVSEGTLKSKS